ncbi:MULTISPECIES: ABC transporter permease [unclassified Pseudoclavibacter]|uniref:ABC transporter permease n=1 Tax=unclassified Pseudoclavibacter TaxID=2615177 RepID=UPI000CE82877|nr:MULTISPECIES: ABC transporter permease [unclassified Pseudoclavibacter]MBS3178562.1 ABC transporter permease [Pseudoclavibacter sp. Marseille-Q4354]NYF15108.1 simple sugar transport system permease protein [Pseudoclavibacter sp. JAI123]PPG27520.1 ABC transporter permease [Pseudoclavibacter sp. RFBB5]
MTAVTPSTEEQIPVGASTKAEVRTTRSWKAPIAYAFFSALVLVVFGLLAPAGASSTIDLNSDGVPIKFDPLVLPTMVTNLVIGVILAGITVVAFLRTAAGAKLPMWVMVVFGILWVWALIVFIGANANVPLTWLLTGTLAISTPLIFGSMAGLVSERVGVVNIAIEGQLLAGAFTSALIGSMTGNPFLGLLGAILAGMLVSLILAVFSIRYLVEQVVVGVVINMLVIGLTNFLYSGVMTRDSGFLNTIAQNEKYPRFAIPLLSDIPVIGPLLFDNTFIVYLMFITVPVLTFALFKTRWGLRLRAVGEHPKAADTVGIKVNKTRFWNVLLSGAIAGAGGSFFTLGSVGSFSQEMTSGQGYIALAALIFGRWHPVYATLAALLFGFASNLKTLVSQVGANIPPEFMAMIPYIVTILAVAGFVGQSRGPAAAGKPYVKA